MATKLWLPSTGTAPASPAYAGYWTIQSVNSGIARWPMSTTLGATAQATANAWENSATSGVTTLSKQYVSTETLPVARTVDGTVTFDSWQWTSGFGAADGGALAVVVKVVSGDGATLRGVAYQGAPGAAVFGAATRRTDTVTLTPVAAQAGDRIVVEVGAALYNTATSGTQLNIYVGEAGANAPSVEFSADLFGAATIVGGTVTETTTVNAGTATADALVAGGTVSEATTVNPGAVFNGDFVAGGTVTETTTVNPGTVSQQLRTVGVSTNTTSGRSRGGVGRVEWEPPVAGRPDGVALEPLAYEVAVAFDTPTITDAGPRVTASKAERPRDRHRIVVARRDVTFFRDVVTPELDYQLISPLTYGPATLTLPQVYAAFEEPGVGALSWLKPGARVIQQRVDADGNVVAVDYRGVIIAFDTDGADLRVEVGGEVSGRAALRQRQVPLYRQVKDIGRQVYNAVRPLARMEPFLGPETGIEVAVSGGTSLLDHINRLCSLAATRSGNQWTIRDNNGDGTYRMARKDTSTIDGTVYPHDGQLPANLRRDIAEEPNRIYGTGVTPAGMRVLNGVYPGMRQGGDVPYPFTDGRAFGEGTVDADTDTGDGVTAMIHHLRVHGYLTRDDSPGAYDADVTDAVSALQEDADLAVSGNMNENTWAALYDTNATGYSMGWSRIEPLAQKSYTRRLRRTASGAVSGRNPNFDRSRLVVDRNVDFGVGVTRGQMREWARNERDKGEDNWVGTIRFETGALIYGQHTPGDPLAEVDVMPARALRPGMNLSLPLFMGGITVHVSALSVSGGVVTATVDTRARDTLPVWEVIRRNRESRRNPHRAWVRDHLSSGMVRDAITEFSEVGGILGDKVELTGGEWRVFPVPSGRAGTVKSIRTNTSPNAEYVLAVFGTRISPGRLKKDIGNPLSTEGRDKWTNENVRTRLDRDHLLLYVAGDADAPCGYWPHEPDDTAIFTGEWQDDAGFGYSTGPANVIYVAVYADRDTTIPAGRIMWPQLEPA